MIRVVDIGCAITGGTAIVRARGESGAVGLGEATPLPGRSRDTADECGRAVAALRGVVPLTVTPASALSYAADLAAAVAEHAPAARFAIETALCDLVARTAGWPLARVLSATPSPVVPLNALVATVDDARRAIARGITCVKLKLHGAIDADLALARAVRDAIGDARLRIDANLAWPATELDARLDALAALDVEYVEEPAPGVARRARAPRAVPLALDESLADPERDAWLDDALASGAIAVVVLKPTLLGGLATCKAIAARARAFGVDAVVTHANDGAIAVAAACELARALGDHRAHGLDRPELGVPQLGASSIRDAGRAGLGIVPPRPPRPLEARS